MKKLILAICICLMSGISVTAQDAWAPSETGGFGNAFNEYIRSMTTFKGFMYAGTGTSSGELFRTSTGTEGSWVNIFSSPLASEFTALGQTTEGGGYLYASTKPFGGDSTHIYTSFDGVTWTIYYKADDMDPIQHIVPYKGLGTVDSIYIFEEDFFGTRIHRSWYDSNDPYDTIAGGSWDSIMDFSIISLYTHVKSTLVANGKLYTGTNNGATLWSYDGITWLQNIWVGNGFGNPNNNEITALEYYGGYIYAGTYNSTDGAQIWRSNDEMTWSLVNTYPGYRAVTDFEVVGGELWVALEGMSTTAKVIRSTDGLTFNTSMDDGFGFVGNHGEDGVLAVMGNNMYYGLKNYGMGALAPPPGAPASRGGGPMSTGGQIWRTCLVTPPTVDLGPDTLVCSGTNVILDAGAGMIDYHWSTEDSTQTISVGSPGGYVVWVTDGTGCSNSDIIQVEHKASPTVTPQLPDPWTLCYGDNIMMNVAAYSNIMVPETPFSTVTHDTIDGSLGDQLDSILVSGVTGTCACNDLYSVTIDSLDHAWAGDVIIGIYSPSGSYVDLTLGSGGSSNLGYHGTEFKMSAATPISAGSAPFTGSYIPSGDFNTLSGNANGYWVLKTGDTYPSADHGVLKGWSIRFQHNDTMLTYSWTPGGGLSSTTIIDPIASPLTTTTYTLAVTNSNSCTSTSTSTLEVPAINLTVADDSICFGASTSISGTGGSTYFWNTTPSLSSSIGATVIATPATDEVFWVHDTASGCYFTDTVTIYVDDTVVVDGGFPPTICYSDTALLSATAISGTPPFSYMWSGPSGSSPTQSVSLSPDSTELWGVIMTDGFGCNSSGFSVYVNVMPSTDIHGHVTYSGGDVTDGTAVAYEFKPYLIHFDTIQVSPLDGSGYYHFSAIDHADYIVKVFPNTATYPTLIPTYYGNTFLWDSAIVFSHACFVNDTLDIAVEEELIIPSGPGLMGGRIVEGVGFERLEGDPIPGIDVKLGRNPGGALITSTQTSTNGDYVFPNLPLSGPGESYVVYADIPGIGRDSSYNVVLDVTNPVYDSLNYLVDSTTVYILETSGTGVAEGIAGNNALSVYPNPSNGIVNIEYALSKNSKMSLGIYNVLGVRIRELVNSDQQAGNYKYSFNFRNYNLSAGVYFISLITDGKVSTHRLVITE